MKVKLTLPDKIVIACVVAIVLLTAYAYIFFSQVIMYIAFALILAATLLYSIWHIVEYTKKKDQPKSKILFVKMIISSAVCLIAIVLSVLCYTGIWFVVT